MKKVVNGNYSDQDSTRDLVGLVSDEVRVLIDYMREGIKASKSYAELDDKTFIEFYAKMNFGAKITTDEAQQIKAQIHEDNNKALKLYEAINEPYVGATYEGRGGQVMIGKKNRALTFGTFPGCEYFKRKNTNDQ